MVKFEEWAEIRRLHKSERMSVRAIARRLGLARNTVRAALRSDEPPAYRRERTGSAVDAFEPGIRQLLAVTPDMPATVIAERVGWERGMSVFRERVAELRPLYVPLQAFGRTNYQPGEIAQWDLWEPPVDIPVGFGQSARLQVLVGALCFSRYVLAELIGTKSSEDVLCGHLRLIAELGEMQELLTRVEHAVPDQARLPTPESRPTSPEVVGGWPTLAAQTPTPPPREEPSLAHSRHNLAPWAGLPKLSASCNYVVSTWPVGKCTDSAHQPSSECTWPEHGFRFIV